ncbi:MAG: hypothetical protein FD130_1647 [Halothiobacillaceae bacterium]|nr:MAG: hypothetical protein FD130_1647 [Halothiobacillaceae bacterium]
MFARRELMVDSVELRTVLRLYSYSDREVFTITTIAPCYRPLPDIRRVPTHDGDNDGIQLNMGMAHRFDGEVAGEGKGGVVKAHGELALGALLALKIGRNTGFALIVLVLGQHT